MINSEDPTTWVYYTDETTRQLIDAEMQSMASLESTKGIDSTPQEKRLINDQMTGCLNRIKDLDINFWGRLCPSKDEEVVK